MRRALALLGAAVGLLLAAAGVLALFSVPLLLEFNAGARRPSLSGGVAEYGILGVLALVGGAALVFWFVRVLSPASALHASRFSPCSSVGLCACLCHGRGSSLVHPVPCCFTCPYCGHPVTSGALAAHKAGGPSHVGPQAGT
jgi:hypothetical protein